MTLLITPIYAALLAILMAVLSTAASMQRGQHNVPLGHGGVSSLSLAVRRFGNLTEYAPMAIVLMAFLEVSGLASHWLHAFGATLVALRLLHPFMLFEEPSAPLWRKTGRFVAAAGTALLLCVGSVVLLLMLY